MARALYIHWPFCLKKCPYCDFNSHVRQDVDSEAWQTALTMDMAFEAEIAGGETLTSIFFGGGTPSLMPPTLVDMLLKEAQRLWGFADDIEITLEANPTSFEAEKFARFRAAGVNRVSLGIQSLDNAALRFLGREHSVDEALAALEAATQLFDRVSFDLIYARPGQTEAQWRSELEAALAFGTDHLSLYQLTIEPNTRFATDVRRGAFQPMDDDRAAGLYDLTNGMMRDAGMAAYEISNYARPGSESRHNLTYWRYHDYAGVGPGAHGRRNARATMRHRKPENFLEAVRDHGHGLVDDQPLTNKDRAAEALLMGLRLAEGVDLQSLAARLEIGSAAMVDGDAVARYCDLGLLWREGERIGVTPRGMPLLDGLLAEIVADGLVST